jgi:hypothetical protein
MNGLRLREGMTVLENERVEVYFNIHKSGFSIKSIDKRNPNKGKVIGYADQLQLKNCKFVCSKSGIAKVREEKRKRVCAVVRGYLQNTDPLDSHSFTEIYFNPYKTDKFIDTENQSPIDSTEFVYFFKNKCARY